MVNIPRITPILLDFTPAISLHRDVYRKSVFGRKNTRMSCSRMVFEYHILAVGINPWV